VPQVVTLGDINLDIIAHISYYPPSGGDGLAQQASMHSGGSAANTAIALARLGVETGLIGRVGKDPMAEWALAELAEAGVELSAIQRDEEAMTGMMFIAVTPDGERTMFGYRGANARTSPALLDESYIASASLLHLSGYALLEEPQRDAALLALEMAHRAGLAVSLDLGLEATLKRTEEVRDLLPQIDLLLLTLAEAERLTGCRDAEEAAKRLLSCGAKAVALKLGERGCLISSEEGNLPVPAFSVEVKDTTGAGDAFDAGLIFGRLKGLGWRESAVLANALGALAASVEGAGGSLPGRREVCAFLEEHEGDPSWQGWRRELRCLLDLL